MRGGRGIIRDGIRDKAHDLLFIFPLLLYLCKAGEGEKGRLGGLRRWEEEE